MKRIGCLIAALSLLMTLSACHTGGEVEPTLRIGVALYQQEDTFISTVAKELQRAAQEAEQDGEGLQTMRVLARNMTFLMRCIALGREQFGLPEKEARIATHFIR